MSVLLEATYRELTTPDDLRGYRQLAACVLQTVVDDIRTGGERARRRARLFVERPGCVAGSFAWYCEMAGLAPGAVRERFAELQDGEAVREPAPEGQRMCSRCHLYKESRTRVRGRFVCYDCEPGRSRRDNSRRQDRCKCGSQKRATSKSCVPCYRKSLAGNGVCACGGPKHSYARECVRCYRKNGQLEQMERKAGA